jgi:hypothetical protein
VRLDGNWKHLEGLQLADPDFGTPGRVDVLLGIDIFSSALLQGRRHGGSNLPIALETCFGWVVTGNVQGNHPQRIISHHASILSDNELLQRFWELEENNPQQYMTPDEEAVVTHFRETHRFDSEGRFIVPLPMKPEAKTLGESRSLVVRRFLTMERSLHLKNQFQRLDEVMREYFDMGHTEPVPAEDLEKPCKQVFYLPIHAVSKESSTTTKLRAVFDASAKSSTGVSLSNQLMIGPTVHSSLVEVLIRFRLYRVAMTADVSRMYRAVVLPHEHRDLHRFVWRRHPNDQLVDYRMTRATFGVSASSFMANMSVKQNAVNHAFDFPTAVAAVHRSFYVDDGLVGADSIKEAIELQAQLQELFNKGHFLLCK